VTPLCQCGCGKPAPIAKRTRPDRGYCKGQPLRFIKGHQFRRDISSRFWEKVDKSPGIDDCWNWTGAKNHGYGVTWNDKCTVHATHVAIFIETGRWPILDVCHHCDNPSCVRFSHLFEGTARDNALDALQKGRLKIWNRGKCKLNPEQKQQIRDASQSGESYRAIGRRYGITHRFVSKIVRGVI
jgi:HNH endonuclease